MAGELVYIGGFSGGIDSQAAARVMIDRHGADRVTLVNTDAGGNEHPLTCEHIAWYSANVHPVVKIDAVMSDHRSLKWCAEKGIDPNTKLTFLTLSQLKARFPSRTMQFCTEVLKMQPVNRWTHANYPEGNYVRFDGMRKDESRKRAHFEPVGWDDYFDCEVHHPIGLDEATGVRLHTRRRRADKSAVLARLLESGLRALYQLQQGRHPQLGLTLPRGDRQGSRLGKPSRHHVFSAPGPRHGRELH
jgi:hypothetical protein